MPAYRVLSRVYFVALFSALGAFSAQAATIVVTDQSEFEAAVATATQAGASDTIEVDAESVSSSNFSLPGDASSLTINFNGSGSATVYNPVFFVGKASTGTLDIGPGTTLNFSRDHGIPGFLIGFDPGGGVSNGTVNMTGGTIQGFGQAEDLSHYLTMSIGRRNADSVGVFNQSGGEINIGLGALNIGVEEGTGTYTMSGDAKITFSAGGTVYLGEGGGTGTIYVHDNAQFLHLGGGGDLYIGEDGGTGTIIQDGAGSLVVLGSDTRLGGEHNAGTGTYVISAGQMIVGEHLRMGRQAASMGTIDQSGGVVTLDGHLRYGPGTGIYNLTGGTLQINNSNPFRLESDGAPGTREFNLGGGTIQALTDFSTSNLFDFSLTGGMSTIDTFDGTTGHTVEIAGVFDGAGGLEKAGDGVLILSAISTYTGGTLVSGGTLQLDTGASLASGGDLQVDSGATFDLNDNDQTVGDFSGGGDVLLGTAELTTESANNTEFSGSISGTGTFVKDGSGTLLLSGDSTYDGPTTVEDGKLTVNGTLVSDVNVNGGILGGNGTIGSLVLASGATLSPGNSIGTMHVTGSVTFNPGSIYAIEVGDGQADRTIATGAANLDGTVAVTQTGVLAVSSPYTILTASSVNGTFGGVTGSFTFLTPTLDYDATNAYLIFTRNSTSLADVAQTPNQAAVAGALDQFPDSNPLLATILSGDANGARQAFDALSGEIYASVPGVLADQSRFVRGAIVNRLTQASGGGQFGGGQSVEMASAGPAMDGRMALGAGGGKSFHDTPSSSPGLVFWTQAYGTWGDFEDGSNAATVERSLGGFVSGADADIGGGWRAGFATGYSRADLNSGARLSSADVDSYLLAAYAGGKVGPLAVKSGAAWSWHSIDATRFVSFTNFFEREEADYDGDTGQLFAEVAYPILHGDTKVEAFGGLAWVHMSTDGFTETGGSAALVVSGTDDDIGYSTLGARASTIISTSGMSLAPRVSVAWQHAFGSTTPDINLAFASTGIGYGITGVPIAEDSALMEAGFDLLLSPDATLGFSYVGQLSKDVQDNGIQGYVSVRY